MDRKRPAHGGARRPRALSGRLPPRGVAIASTLRNTGQAHALTAALAASEIYRIVAQRIHAIAMQIEPGIEHEPGLRGKPGLLHVAEQRQRLRKMKMRQRKVAVRLDAPPQPDRRLGILTKLQLGYPDEQHPAIDEDVARRETERFPDMALGLLGAADEILGHANAAVGIRKIAIQRQRALAGT